MIKTQYKNILVILLGIIGLGAVIVAFKSKSYTTFLAAYFIIFIALSLKNKHKKIWYCKNHIIKGIKMEKEILERLLEKEVAVHTIDEYITGKVAEVTDSTLIIKKVKKDGTVKHTYYVQNNAIMSILENN